jgi:hypothetical protein
MHVGKTPVPLVPGKTADQRLKMINLCVNATIHGRTTDELRTADEMFMVQQIQDPKALTLSRHSRPAIIQ